MMNALINLLIYIVIAELLRWKVTWCKNRPVLTYILLLIVLGILGEAMAGGDVILLLLFGLAINILFAYGIYILLRSKLAWPKEHPKKAFALAFVLVLILQNIAAGLFLPDDLHQEFEDAVMQELESLP